MASQNLPAALLGSSAYLIIRIRRHVYRQLADDQGKLGLRIGHGAILTCLEDCGPLNQGELGEMLGTDASEVVRCIDGLQKMGLIERQADDDDRRRNLLTITPAGRVMGARYRATIADAEQEIFGALTADEFATLQDLLRRVAMTPEEAARPLKRLRRAS